MIRTCWPQLRLLDDIIWLFARGGMGEFIEMEDQTYKDLTLTFFRTLHMEGTGALNVRGLYIILFLEGVF